MLDRLLFPIVWLNAVVRTQWMSGSKGVNSWNSAYVHLSMISEMKDAHCKVTTLNCYLDVYTYRINSKD